MGLSARRPFGVDAEHELCVWRIFGRDSFPVTSEEATAYAQMKYQNVPNRGICYPAKTSHQKTRKKKKRDGRVAPVLMSPTFHSSSYRSRYVGAILFVFFPSTHSDSSSQPNGTFRHRRFWEEKKEKKRVAQFFLTTRGTTKIRPRPRTVEATATVSASDLRGWPGDETVTLRNMNKTRRRWPNAASASTSHSDGAIRIRSLSLSPFSRKRLAPRGRQTDCFRLRQIFLLSLVLFLNLLTVSVIVYILTVYITDDPSGRQRVCGSIFTTSQKRVLKKRFRVIARYREP